jgi:hypothetical protein
MPPRDRLYPLVYPAPQEQPLLKTPRTKVWKPKGPFRFLDLPGEVRNRIYEFALVDQEVIDLDPANHRRIAPRLTLLSTCRQIYEESYHIFYSRQAFRLFPVHPAFFQTKKVLLTRLPAKYRKEIATLELRLGPGWSKPPKTWNMGPKLGLSDCTSVRRLNIFVEVDPSHDIFKGFRVDDRFYTIFCGHLLEELFEQVPSLEEVHLEAWPSVPKEGSLMNELVGVSEAENKRVIWGKNFTVNMDKMQCETMEMMMAMLKV